MPIVVLLNVIMQNVIMPSYIMLSVITLDVKGASKMSLKLWPVRGYVAARKHKYAFNDGDGA